MVRGMNVVQHVVRGKLGGQAVAMPETWRGTSALSAGSAGSPGRRELSGIPPAIRYAGTIVIEGFLPSSARRFN
jgi:hypothetical protein